MSLGWDQDRGRRGPSATLVSFNVLLVATVVSALVIAAYRYAVVWTPLQRRYLSSYGRSGLAWTTASSYDLLYIVGRTGRRLALDEELVTVTTLAGDTSFALADSARHDGTARLVWQRESYDPDVLHQFLGRWIYHDQTLVQLVQPTLWGALAVFLGGILGVRTQAVVQTRAWRTRYGAGEAEWTMGSAVIDVVDRPPRALDTSGASANRLPERQRPPLPASVPARAKRAIAAGDVTHPPGSPAAPPVPWADAFFT